MNIFRAPSWLPDRGETSSVAVVGITVVSRPFGAERTAPPTVAALARHRGQRGAAPAPVSLTNGSIVARANIAQTGNTYSVAVVASNTLNRLARRLYQ